MPLLVFDFMANLLKKKFPRTPYETCKQGSRRITLLEYDNRSPKNFLSPILSPSPKKGPKNGEFFSSHIFSNKKFILLFLFLI
jgi:hypothetical protein